MEELPTPNVEPGLKIVRRIGRPALHRQCHDSLAWRQVIFPDQDGDFWILTENTSKKEDPLGQALMPDIEALGEGGGIAHYERIGSIARSDFANSANAVLWMTGVRELPDGSIQEPIFPHPFDPLPERRPEHF